jgi:hypothetical protein
MPTEVEGPVYCGNAVRITLRTKTWADLLASADELAVSIRKLEGVNLVEIPTWQGIAPSPSGPLREESAGVYRLLVSSRSFSAGTYFAEFRGVIDGSVIYEPVEWTFQTLEEAVRAR